MSERSHPSRLSSARSSQTKMAEAAELHFWSQPPDYQADPDESQIFNIDDKSEQAFLIGLESCPIYDDVSPAMSSPYLCSALLDHPSGEESQNVTIGRNSESEQAVLADSESARAPYNAASLALSSSPVLMYALIIGVDNYPNCTKLRGAVADAEAMRGYLEQVLRVSQDHIRMLLDHQATRNAIIEHIKGFRNDERIRKGDPIVIFYAGHGGELDGPSAWGLDRKVQCIVPYDYKECKECIIHTIPDRTLGALIEDIAKVKGDNITVIFDCCHSAGCVRDESEEYVPRTVDLDLQMPEDLDDDIFQGRIGAIPGSLAWHGFLSHVLLAACSESELAFENKGRGMFTTALLRELKASGISDLNYVQLVERIHLPKQRPQCHGANRNRILFRATVSAGKQVRHMVHMHHGGKYVIAAGLAHGISLGGKFTLYGSGGRLGVLNVERGAVVGDFQTTVTTSEVQLRNAVYAKLTLVGKLPLYLPQGANSSQDLKKICRKMIENGTNIRLVEDAQEAKLRVVMENHRIVFGILDSRATKFGLTKLPQKVPLDTVPRVLAGASQFFWFLGLKNDRVGAHRSVAVDFYAVKKRYSDNGSYYFVACGDGLCKKDSDGMDAIDFVVENGTRYGIEITNNTRYALFLNAFLFNYSSLSIIPYYTQSSAGNSEAPLKPTGTFTIGYGENKTIPLTYWLNEGQDVDVGYLKIFLATRPIDMSDVTQPSPFDNSNGQPQTYDDGTREGGLGSDLPGAQQHGRAMDTWFTVEVPIVQRRFPGA